MEARTRTRLIVAALAAAAVLLVAGNLLFGVKPRYPRPGPQPQASASSTPAPSPAPGAPGVLAPAGTPLQPMAQPPAGTIAGVDPKAGGRGASWTGTFGLYGLGPSRSGRVTVVAEVDSVRPGAGTPASLSPVGRSVVLVVPSPRDVSVMKTGGTYTGTLTLELSEGALRFVVRDVQKR